MARYRKIDVRIWNDEHFAALSDDGRLAFLFLLTHPNLTSLGAMRATKGGLAEELRWSLAKFTRALGGILARHMAEHDAASAFMWLPNFLKYNPAENGNVVKGWLKALDLLPECALREQMLQAARHHCERSKVPGVSAAFREAFGGPSPKPFGGPSGKPSGNCMPNQEQEQEQERERAPARATSLSVNWGASPTQRRRSWLIHESAIGIDVTEAMHRTYVARLANIGAQDADGELRAFYHRTEQAWRGKDPGPAWKFWDARVDELARKRADPHAHLPQVWTCQGCGSVHRGTREQKTAGWCPAKAASA